MFVLATATAVAGFAASAAPARAQGAIVFRIGPEGGCEVGPTDIPGVPVDIPANCLFVVTPSGNAMLLVRAQIPAGFALSETFAAQLPCFFPGLGPGSGRIVATPGGQITAHCYIRAWGEVIRAIFYNFADGEVARHIPRVWDTATPEAALADCESAFGGRRPGVIDGRRRRVHATAVGVSGRTRGSVEGEGRVVVGEQQ
jgi:hypothetical protein